MHTHEEIEKFFPDERYKSPENKIKTAKQIFSIFQKLSEK
jgi:hypothetical protein